jgi:D-xylose transport system ATP-binding protein
MIRPAAEAPLLEAREITKDFPGVRALDGVSFSVRPGEVHALVGENGAGKSTLIKVLAGVHPHGSYGGDVCMDGAPVRFRTVRDAETSGIAVIYQELALVKHMTVAENILLGDEPRHLGMVDHDAMVSAAEALMQQLGVRVDVRSEVIHLGVGMQQLVEIAKAIRKQGRVLVLDEPTAALAEHEVATLIGIARRLRERGVGMVYISHKLDEVFEIADRITVLRDGQTVGSDITANWTRERVVTAMVGRPMNDMFPRVEHQRGDVALEVQGLSLEDPEVPGRLLVDDVSFKVHCGEILGIAGLVGSGRTELVSAIFGCTRGPRRGKIFVDGRETTIRSPADGIRAGMAFVPEDRKQHGLGLMFSVLENLTLVHLREFCRFGVIDSQREFVEARETAEALKVKTTSLDVAVNTLSGGNQQKVVLGKWLMRPPRILFLDEPTRGIDVGAKAEIHRLIGELTARGMAVVMVSSELPEVLGAADRILVLREGRVAGSCDREVATPDKIMEMAT